MNLDFCITDFNLTIETENFYLDTYPSVGTVLLFIVLFALCIYTITKIFKDIRVVVYRIRIKRLSKKCKKFLEQRNRRKIYDYDFNIDSCDNSNEVFNKLR